MRHIFLYFIFIWASRLSAPPHWHGALLLWSLFVVSLTLVLEFRVLLYLQHFPSVFVSFCSCLVLQQFSNALFFFFVAFHVFLHHFCVF